MSLNNDIKKLIRSKVKEGWREEKGKHIKLHHPLGGFVVISVSPSCHHALRNIEGDIRRLEKSKKRELA